MWWLYLFWAHLIGRIWTGWERCTFCFGDACGCWLREPDAAGWLLACWPFWRRGTVSVSDCMLQAELRLSKDELISFISSWRPKPCSAHKKVREERNVNEGVEFHQNAYPWVIRLSNQTIFLKYYEIILITHNTEIHVDIYGLKWSYPTWTDNAVYKS